MKSGVEFRADDVVALHDIDVIVMMEREDRKSKWGDVVRCRFEV
jgi:hypothetical protein